MKTIISLLITVFSISCFCTKQQESQIQPLSDTSGSSNVLQGYDSVIAFGAGYRYSSYGTSHLGVKDQTYWIDAAQTIASKFDGCSPTLVWILGVLNGEGTYLNFPATTSNTLINSANTDFNEVLFNHFDSLGIKVWLQVEPGNAPVKELIQLVLQRYKHHPCVIGFGVDVEWYKSVDKPDGERVTDELAALWLNQIRRINPEYRLFLKHWLVEKMPPTYHKDIVFIDDSQELGSMQNMLDEFQYWGSYFSEGLVGFQYGYQSDKSWWQAYEDPAKYIGDKLKHHIPNTIGLYWVDFTLEVILEP